MPPIDSKITVRMDRHNVDAYIGGPVKRDVERRGRNVRDRAKQLVPKRTTALMRSIRSQVFGERGNWTARVGSRMQRSIWVHNGTGLYGPRRRLIRPRNGQFLTFQLPDGRWIRTRSVRGMRPTRFLTGALPAARE